MDLWRLEMIRNDLVLWIKTTKLKIAKVFTTLKLLNTTAVFGTAC